MATINDVVGHYIKKRDDIREMMDRHKEELAPLKEELSRIENFFSDYLEKTGAENIKTKQGTVYRSTTYVASVEDWDATLGWILEDPNDRSAFLERRVSKGAVMDYMEQTDEPIPGVKIGSSVRINFRRS